MFLFEHAWRSTKIRCTANWLEAWGGRGRKRKKGNTDPKQACALRPRAGAQDSAGGRWVVVPCCSGEWRDLPRGAVPTHGRGRSELRDSPPRSSSLTEVRRGRRQSAESGFQGRAAASRRQGLGPGLPAQRQGPSPQTPQGLTTGTGHHQWSALRGWDHAGVVWHTGCVSPQSRSEMGHTSPWETRGRSDHRLTACPAGARSLAAATGL